MIVMPSCPTSVLTCGISVKLSVLNTSTSINDINTCSPSLDHVTQKTSTHGAVQSNWTNVEVLITQILQPLQNQSMILYILTRPHSTTGLELVDIVVKQVWHSYPPFTAFFHKILNQCQPNDLYSNQNLVQETRLDWKEQPRRDDLIRAILDVYNITCGCMYSVHSNCNKYFLFKLMVTHYPSSTERIT